MSTVKSNSYSSYEISKSSDKICDIPSTSKSFKETFVKNKTLKTNKKVQSDTQIKKQPQSATQTDNVKHQNFSQKSKPTDSKTYIRTYPDKPASFSPHKHRNFTKPSYLNKRNTQTDPQSEYLSMLGSQLMKLNNQFESLSNHCPNQNHFKIRFHKHHIFTRITEYVTIVDVWDIWAKTVCYLLVRGLPRYI